MKNLNLLKNFYFQTSELANCAHLAIGINDTDPSSHACPFLYFLKDSSIFCYNPESELKTKVVDLKDYLTNTHHPQLVSFDFLHISHSLVIVEGGGDVLNIPIIGSGPYQGECVGTVQCGIQAACWSPDEGIIVIITNEDKMILMSASFDPIIEVDLSSAAPVENGFVSVGWGKKETQFHGSEGKQAARKTVSVVNLDPSLDDRKIRITWRGDGSLFAVGYFCSASNARKLRIFNSDGMLVAVNEPAGGLEEPLAWRPSGNLIASTCILPNKHIVAFFEKNGLKHGDFSLPENIKVKNLFWNTDSRILSALALSTSCNKDMIFLWTVNNYHWYLKKEMSFDAKISLLKWDVQNSNRMFVLLNDGSFIVYDWLFSVDQTESFSSESQAFVGVIDGANLRMTPFKKCIVPPPMYKYSLSIESSINSVSFLNDCRDGGNVNDVCIFGIDKVYVYSFNAADSHHSLEGSYNYPKDTVRLLHHWVWLSRKKFCCIGSNEKLKNILYLLEADDQTLNVRHSLVLEGAALTLTKKENQLLIQLDSGQLYICDTINCILKPFNLIALPEPCSLVIFEDFLFGLSFANRLYFQDRVLSTGVTSAYYQKPFLLVTTTQHRLIIFDCSSGNNCEELSDRNIERGAVLVTTTGLSVILQIPRGNLETIQPRAMTISTAGKLIDTKDYLGAMTLLRKQRIDLNLIVDHNPHFFLQNISEFVRQVDDVSWISLFISELHGSDTTKGIYAAYYKKRASQWVPLTNKVDLVCRTLCDNMISCSSEDYCLPILGTYVKTSQMEKAMKLAQSEKALKHLLFLVDIDTLYETALAVYDLEMALKIASKSQKDPKEYVPFLNLLKSLEPNYRKFTIDKQLRKYESAICNLAACEGKFEELETFMVEFGLYSTAIKLFPPDGQEYKILACRYAEYMQDKKLYEEAAFLFEEGDCLQNAVAAYSKAGLWKECLVLANRLKYDNDAINTLLTALVKRLKSQRNYTDAGYICAHLLRDVPLSIEVYLQGLLFSDAVYIAESHNVPELINQIIEPGVQDMATNIQEDILKDKEKFTKHLSRLKQVRVDKQNFVNRESDFLSDVHSETSSVSSFNTSNASTHSSRTSCRSARKQQRKMWSLKEGNPREEISLVSALSQLILANHKLTKDVHEICKFLLKFKEFDKAKQLQLSLSELLKLMKENQSVIWPDLGNDENQPVSVEEALLKFPPAIEIDKNWESSILN